MLFGYVHKYEAMLCTFEKLRKTIFCYKNDQFFTKGVEISVNVYFSYIEKVASAKVGKVLLIIE